MLVYNNRRPCDLNTKDTFLEVYVIHSEKLGLMLNQVVDLGKFLLRQPLKRRWFNAVTAALRHMWISERMESLSILEVQNIAEDHFVEEISASQVDELTINTTQNAGFAEELAEDAPSDGL
jgi:hypothetical protein